MMPIEERTAREKIQHLRMSYCAHLDAMDLDALVLLFTPRGICDFGDRPTGGRWQGRDALRDFFGRHMRARKEAFDTLHLMSNPWIRLIDRRHAAGRWYVSIMTQARRNIAGDEAAGPMPGPLSLLGVYEDRYELLDGAWLFSEVRLHRIWPVRDAFEAFEA